MKTKNKDKNKKQKQWIIAYCILYIPILIFQSYQAVSSPYLFVRSLSLFVVITTSIVIGAFIRELFILKKYNKS
ncbi:hypothetical protein [Longirhabdus pacifica]|uniref:hypothetical protein n=1 Tax=Longirhabdus pacifica TaxID=2305227 RepID=UPI00100930E9|nr:hypothetical protein [Longirhabdus pacifica]